MPLTFIEIEEQKNWRIGIFFLLLVFLYIVLIMALAVSVCEMFLVEQLSACYGFLTPRTILGLFAFCLLLAATHFFFSASDTVRSIKETLGVMNPDPRDEIHKRLINIVEEIHVVTGGGKQIECAVIPTLAMNALAAVDLRGRALIAVTEGLVSRVSRPQLEAVVAHEACHILSGDCLETTVAASLFGIPAAAIEKLSRASHRRSFFSPAFLLAWILLRLSQLVHLVISREREYRADAGAVRMTRDPLALAEVLFLLSRRWRGAGFIGAGLEMLSFINPATRTVDESEGWLADALSTHPPINKRIKVLLQMVRVSLSEMDAKMRPTISKAASTTCEPAFYALHPTRQWQGPYTITDLAELPWLSPLTWIKDRGGQSIERAWKNPLIDPLFAQRLAGEEKHITPFTCPSCQQSLLETPYEKTQVSQCHFCGGVLVENTRIPRILARTEKTWTDRMQSLAKTAFKEGQRHYAERMLKGLNRKMVPRVSCPHCHNPMMRTFHSLAYLVEIDRCNSCGLTWFDKDELEMLQCMIENQMASEPVN